jgi:hypothetical protein
VLDDHTFKVAQDVGSKVFVYGKEVDDFRDVSYDSIAMLNLSATQALAKKIEALEEKIKKLEGK